MNEACVFFSIGGGVALRKQAIDEDESGEGKKGVDVGKQRDFCHNLLMSSSGRHAGAYFFSSKFCVC